MTDDTTRQTRRATDRMKDVSHTHPHDDRGAGPVFMRGPTVVADGGERPAVAEAAEDEAADEDEETDEMRDVSHTPPHDDEGANRVFARGGEEVREESVDEE